MFPLVVVLSRLFIQNPFFATVKITSANAITTKREKGKLLVRYCLNVIHLLISKYKRTIRI